jgi:RNA polymerase sigma-70 factor (ECF subfamily)
MQELDAVTVQRARRGDRAAQEIFLRRYVRPLHAFLRRSGLSHEADDATQELLAKLIRVLPQFDPNGTASLTTWVFTVAHRWLIDEKRKRHLSVAPLDEALQVADAQPRPDEQLASRQLRSELERAVSQLPEAQRRVFVLFNVHQHPLEQIAEVERVPMGTLKSRLHRARAALASALFPLLDDHRGGVDHVRHG